MRVSNVQLYEWTEREIQLHIPHSGFFTYGIEVSRVKKEVAVLLSLIFVLSC